MPCCPSHVDAPSLYASMPVEIHPNQTPAVDVFQTANRPASTTNPRKRLTKDGVRYPVKLQPTRPEDRSTPKGTL